jgi:hypothetical protein
MLSTFLLETRWRRTRKSATEPLPPRHWVVQVRSAVKKSLSPTATRSACSAIAPRS